jgi:hypothetical protein
MEIKLNLQLQCFRFKNPDEISLQLQEMAATLILPNPKSSLE